MAECAVVILAAGSGSRVGAAVNKVLLDVGDRPMVAWSVATALTVPGVREVVVVVKGGEESEVAAALDGLDDPRVRLVAGDVTRHGSEWQALQAIAPAIDAGAIDVVAIHDAARPRATARLFEQVIGAARETGGALPAIPLGDVVPRPGSEADASPIAGQTLVGVQTPQAFRATALLAAYVEAEREGFTGTDTSACLERYHPETTVTAVPGEPANTKVTFAADLRGD